MAVQNLVSASLTPEARDQILKLVGEVRARLGFLLSLGAEQTATLFKAGKEYQPFVEGCHQVAVGHPEILPRVFNTEEFDKDYSLGRDLALIADSIDQLNTAVAQTLIAVRSDGLSEALEVYAAVKANRDRVPGLDVAADNLGRFFQRHRRTGVRA